MSDPAPTPPRPRTPDGKKRTLAVEIHGVDLPGRRCGPGPEGDSYDDIRVGLARGTDTIDLVPGDATSARWRFDVLVRPDDDGRSDFGGPFVHGKRGERSLGLRWGTLAADGTFTVFRGAKLRFSDVPPPLVQQALTTGGRLVGRLGLTDVNGHPVCASVRPPDIVWSVARPNARPSRGGQPC